MQIVCHQVEQVDMLYNLASGGDTRVTQETFVQFFKNKCKHRLVHFVASACCNITMECRENNGNALVIIELIHEGQVIRAS